MQSCSALHCPQVVLGSVDRTQPPKVWRNKAGGVKTVSFPYTDEAKPLCYFHKKKALGLYDTLPKSALLLEERRASQ
jgi:hypothetical protein